MLSGVHGTDLLDACFQDHRKALRMFRRSLNALDVAWIDAVERNRMLKLEEKRGGTIELFICLRLTIYSAFSIYVRR